MLWDILQSIRRKSSRWFGSFLYNNSGIDRSDKSLKTFCLYVMDLKSFKLVQAWIICENYSSSIPLLSNEIRFINELSNYLQAAARARQCPLERV